MAIAFANYLGVFLPWVSQKNAVLSAGPFRISAVQVVAILLVGFLSWINARGLRTAGRHLPREVAAAAPDVEQSPAAHVAAEVSVRRSKELIPVIVAPGCLPLRVPVRGQVPCFPY